jgi:hypothetical protein
MLLTELTKHIMNKWAMCKAISASTEKLEKSVWIHFVITVMVKVPIFLPYLNRSSCIQNRISHKAKVRRAYKRKKNT